MCLNLIIVYLPLKNKHLFELNIAVVETQPQSGLVKTDIVDLVSESKTIIISQGIASSFL